jgi:hypothetical protein
MYLENLTYEHIPEHLAPTPMLDAVNRWLNKRIDAAAIKQTAAAAA